MQVKVELLAQARPAAGSDVLALEVDPSANLAAALQEIGMRLDDAVRNALFSESGSVRSSVLVLVNGQLVVNCNGQVLADGDTISLLTPIGGG